MKKIKLKRKTTNKKHEKVTWKTILSGILFVSIILLSLFLVFALYIVISSPDFEKEELYQKEPTILYDINGEEFARVGSEDSTVVTYDELPDVLVDALIATEDSRFFQHNGLDLFRFIKASVLQVVGSDSAGGASTLSMQVIKNTYTSNESRGLQGIIRKFTDIYMSVFKLEANYTKSEIIEFYLNSQWFANSGDVNTSGILGVERASQFYFGKSVKDINLAEASLMAGMFQNPYRYNPYRNPEGCRNRQTTVLKLLVRHGYITEEQKDAVLEIPISSMLKERENTGVKVESSQAFIDYVINEVYEDLELDASQTALKIYTTFDPKVQAVVEKAENGDFYEFPNDVVQEGIAITSTKDGSITAMSGGRNYQAKGLNLATDISKQPGSTAKPIFDYAMYIEHISQSTYAMLLDEATTYTNGASISNYDRKYTGLITMRFALDDSRNIPALRAFKAVSALDKNIIKDFVHSVGIDYGKDLYESASIGGFNGVSPLDLSAAYATFARGGYYIEPYSYTKVINTETNKEYNYSFTKEQVMEATTAYMITNILIDAYGGRTASGAQTAGKTGTTNLDSDTKDRYGLPSGALTDAWIVSYSPSHSIALWYGYEKLTSDAAENKYYLTSNTGGTGRRQMMNGLATGIHEKNQSFKVPKNLTTREIELETFPAQLCSPYTPESFCKKEYFVDGTQPTEESIRFSKLETPKNGSYTYSGNTITLKWDAIETPKAIDADYLIEHFNTYYEDYADKYYQVRIGYNNANIGTIGYEIYLKANGTETYLGYTNSNTFNYNVTTGGSYTFVVKSAYSIFKNNMSDGLTISTSTIDNNVNDMVTDNTTDNNNSTTDDELGN